jgi:Cellulase (glycosyl hydrolase family 5)
MNKLIPALLFAASFVACSTPSISSDQISSDQTSSNTISSDTISNDPNSSQTDTLRSEAVSSVPNGFRVRKSININIDEFKSGRGEYTGLPLAAADINRVKASGLDTVRIMADGNYFMENGGDFLNYGAFKNVAVLDAAIQNVLSAGLNAVVDIHAPPATGFNDRILCGGPVELQKFERFLETLARHLDGKYSKSKVALELMNEPFEPKKGCNLDATYGDYQLQRMYTAARRGSSTMTLVISPLASSNPYKLTGLNSFVSNNKTDVNTIFTVHYYGPLEFSHQGAAYVGDQKYLNYFAGIPYPSSPFIGVEIRDRLLTKIKSGIAADPASGISAVDAEEAFNWYLKYFDGNGYSRDDIEFIVKDVVLKWATDQKIAPSRIWLGEFGVQGSERYTRRPLSTKFPLNPVAGADTVDRAGWTKDVRELFEKYGMSWSYFQFGNGAYSVLADRNFPTTNFSIWDSSLTKALGLVTPK